MEITGECWLFVCVALHLEHSRMGPGSDRTAPDQSVIGRLSLALARPRD